MNESIFNIVDLVGREYMLNEIPLDLDLLIESFEANDIFCPDFDHVTGLD